MEQMAMRLEAFPLDWCYNCAEYSIKNKSNKYKIFAYLFIQYARQRTQFIQDRMTWKPLGSDAFLVIIKKEVFEEWDLSFYEKEKWVARYYNFLYMLIKEHLITHASVSMKDRMGLAFKDGDLWITVGIKEIK